MPRSRFLSIALSLSWMFGMVACGSEQAEEYVSQRAGLEIHVPGDYASVQAGIDAAMAGDTILVAEGDYTENLRLFGNMTLRGAGMDKTILRGQIQCASGDFSTIEGFYVTAEGASGYSPDVGISASGDTLVVKNNLVEGFGSGIGLGSENIMTVTGNIVRQNGIGIELFEVGPWVVLSNNLILNNSDSGITLFSYASPRIMHNTIVGNGFGSAYDMGGAGISVGPFNSEVIQNNILVSNHGGINSMQDSNSSNQHNLIWGNVDNYVGDAIVGQGDLSVDPRFVDAPAKDYRLQADSPAIDAGLDVGISTDFLKQERSGAPDMGAYEYVAAGPTADLIISEVLANPLDEALGEFVELYNPTDTAIDAAGLVIDDGDSKDSVGAYSVGSTLVPAGGYAVILDPGYVHLAVKYDIPVEAVLLTVGTATIGSGLSTSDPIMLERDGVVISSYSLPFNPGNGISAERVDLQAGDGPDNWAACPCGNSPGAANCISSGGASAGTPSLIITEVMANPADALVGEYVEILNHGEDAVELTGLVLSDGDSTDVLVVVNGRASLVQPGELALVVDPDLVPFLAAAPYFLDAGLAVVSVEGAALGNGLSSTDPVSLLAADGSTVISTFSHPGLTTAQSIERLDSFEADVATNWTPCPCAEGHSAGLDNCAWSGGGAEVPVLTINEVMANPVDEDRDEFVELFNPGSDAVDLAGLILSDGDATDVLGAFPGRSDTILPAGGYAVILDPEYENGYSIPAGVLWLAPANSTLGNGLTTTDPLTLLAADGVSVVSTFAYPFNPGNGVSAELLGDAGDIPSNWAASSCPAGASPGAPNCAANPDPDPDSVATDLVLSEVMANPEDEAYGEFVEIANLGDSPVDLAGYVLSDGDASDVIEGYLGGPTLLPAGGLAVVLDSGYAGLAEPYVIPAEALLLTVGTATLGSGLSTDDPVSLLAPDGVTLLSTYGTPFNPGNGISAERVDLAIADGPENWVASPCASGSSPGAVNCADQTPSGATVVDVNLASSVEIQQITGIGPATAGAIIAYRDSYGAFESIEQLCVLTAVSPSQLADWRLAEDGEDPFVLGLAGARPVQAFDGVAELLAALPAPASPGNWLGQPVRLRRVACLDADDQASDQVLQMADWGDEGLFDPNGAELQVYLAEDPSQGAYDRSQTDHANAMADWTKEDGDPFADPVFYRWAEPLWSYGAVAYGHVFSVEGVLEVDAGAWRLRVRPKVDAGIDRLVMIERWLDSADWQELQVVWTYNYKPVVIEAMSGYSYSLPHRLALAHPCRAWWFAEHGVWIDVPRCASFGECSPMTTDWNLFNQALAAWRQDPGETGSYCFELDAQQYCFTAEEETMGVEILNLASYGQLTDHCYSSTLANTVLANRSYASIAAYDATYGIGATSLWNLLVCYVRSGDWPEAPEGTVASVLQDVPDNEWSIVTVDEAEVSSISGALFDVCDPGTSDCIAVYSYASLPTGMQVGSLVRVVGQVKYYTSGGFWELTVDGTDTYVSLLTSETARAPVAGDLVINEFLADPGNAICDANCDGLRSASGDEFVEIVNVSAAPLIMDGVTLSDALSVRHVFAAGTTIEPGQVIVVFGAGSLDCTAFAGLQVLEASSGGLSLNNTGDSILLAGASAELLASVTYDNTADHEQSMVLSPDLNDLDPAADVISGFILHMTADDAADRSRFSPGRRIDGGAF